MHRITESEITIDPKSTLTFLEQDDDLIQVLAEDYEAMRDVFARLMKAESLSRPEPARENTTNVEEMRTKRMVARVHIHQLRRDVAYEEEKIAVIDSILEEG